LFQTNKDTFVNSNGGQVAMRRLEIRKKPDCDTPGHADFGMAHGCVGFEYALTRPLPEGAQSLIATWEACSAKEWCAYLPEGETLFAPIELRRSH